MLQRSLRSLAFFITLLAGALALPGLVAAQTPAELEAKITKSLATIEAKCSFEDGALECSAYEEMVEYLFEIDIEDKRILDAQLRVGRKALASPSAKMRYAGVAAIGFTPAAAEDLIVAAAKEEAPEPLTVMMDVVGRVHHRHPALAEKYFQALSNSSSVVRFQAAKMHSSIFKKDSTYESKVVAKLADMLQDDSSVKAQGAACAALASHGPAGLEPIEMVFALTSGYDKRLELCMEGLHKAWAYKATANRQAYELFVTLLKEPLRDKRWPTKRMLIGYGKSVLFWHKKHPGAVPAWLKEEDLLSAFLGLAKESKHQLSVRTTAFHMAARILKFAPGAKDEFVQAGYELVVKDSAVADSVLANMRESMEWDAEHCESIAKKLESASKPNHHEKLIKYLRTPSSGKWKTRRF